MSHELLADYTFLATLQRFDEDLGEQARAGGCDCGGRLHRADYTRKPRGALVDAGETYCKRISFCCAVDGCRARTTPLSLRFLGRRVYLATVVVLVTAMRHGVTPRRAEELRRLVGVSIRTLRRWRQWWLEGFTRLPFWRAVQGRFAFPVDTTRLPASLVERFGALDDALAVVRVLAFLAPITTATCVLEARIPMGL